MPRFREFLISRRAKITPQRAGLPDAGGRRVPGLRRAEVAAPRAGLRNRRHDLRPGLTLSLYAAEPGSPTAHALDLLASWAATQTTATTALGD